MSEGDELVICEGVIDCISLSLLGKRAVGIIGANGFKKEYVELFTKYKIFVIPDNDSAGERFANTIKKSFLELSKVVEIIKLDDDCKDITDYYVKRHG